MDAAAAGDTIIVSPCTYSGPGNWDVNLQGKVLTIQGANPLDPNTVEENGHRLRWNAPGAAPGFLRCGLQ